MAIDSPKFPVSRSRHRRGMAFASTMLILLGLTTLILIGLTDAMSSGDNGLLTFSGNSLRGAQTRGDAESAAAHAEAGVELTMEWLHQQATPPTNTTSFAPALWGASVGGSPARATLNFPDPADSGAGFRVRLIPDAGNASRSQKTYVIESLGWSGRVTQTVRATARLASIAKYAVLYDKWTAGAYWTGGVNTFDGPVHCNNRDGVPTNIIWKNAAGGTPLFFGAGADGFSATAVSWFLNTPGGAGTPASETDWSAIASAGSAAAHLSAPQVAFPTNTDDLKAAALAGASVPTLPGVKIPSSAGAATGGIFVHGLVQQLTLSVSGTYNQNIVVSQLDLLGLALTTTITLDVDANQTIVRINAITGGILTLTTTRYAGLTNGIIYCDSGIGTQLPLKIGGVSGTIADNQTDGSGQISHANRLTIVTGEDDSLNIVGSIRTRTARQIGTDGLPLPEGRDANFTQNAGTLGLVSNQMFITDLDTNSLALTSLEIDAALLALTSFEADHALLRPTGTLNLQGSLATGKNVVLGKSNLLGLIISGFSFTRRYDSRLANSPPPFFPTTGNHYDLLSWQTVVTPSS